MGMHGRRLAGRDPRREHPDPLVLEKQLVVLGRCGQRVELRRPRLGGRSALGTLELVEHGEQARPRPAVRRRPVQAQPLSRRYLQRPHGLRLVGRHQVPLQRLLVEQRRVDHLGDRLRTGEARPRGVGAGLVERLEVVAGVHRGRETPHQVRQDRRLEVARCHGAHVHAQGPELLGQRVRVGLERVLEHAVRTQRLGRQRPRDARHGDDAAAGGDDQVLKGVRDPMDPEDVHLEDRSQIVQRRLGERRDVGDAGVVDESPQARPASVDGLAQARDRSVVGHVAHERLDAIDLRQPSSVGLGAHGGVDRHPTLGEEARGGEADAGTAAGDQDGTGHGGPYRAAHLRTERRRREARRRPALAGLT